MKSIIHFLPALKKNFLLLFIAIPFFLATAFAVTPVSFFDKPSEETSSRSPYQRASSHEEDSGNISSAEQRGITLTAVEPAERTFVSSDEDFNEDEHELEAIYTERFNSHGPSVIATALHTPRENFSSSRHFMPLSSAVRSVLTIPVVQSFDASQAHPIAAIHSSAYLKNLRNRLFLQQDASLDDNQLIENEETVNRAALADGVLPEELRVLRAQETCDFFLPAFKAVQKLVMSTSLDFYKLTRTTTKLPPEVWNKYEAAVQSQKEIFESCREAEQELEAALDAWKEKGGVAVVATDIRDEGNSSR